MFYFSLHSSLFKPVVGFSAATAAAAAAAAATAAAADDDAAVCCIRVSVTVTR